MKLHKWFYSITGFDPTAESLHVGNLLVIMGLLQAQRAGHKSLALIGGFTARIGDPSGKSSERPSLAQDFIDTNTKGIERNLKQIFRWIYPNYNQNYRMYYERHKLEVHKDVEIFKKKTQFDSSCFNVIPTLLLNSELQFST